LKIILKYSETGSLMRYQPYAAVFTIIFFASDYERIKTLLDYNKIKYFQKSNHNIVKRITKYYAI